MARILIVGYGNPMRGDDALGWRAAERLRERIEDPAVEILALHQLTPELMDTLSHVDQAIFIDAAAVGEPGRMAQQRIEPRVSGSGAFTHHAPPEALLAGAQALYGHAPEATLISVTGQDFGPGESLSAAVAASLPALLDAVASLVKRSDDRNGSASPPERIS